MTEDKVPTTKELESIIDTGVMRVESRLKLFEDLEPDQYGRLNSLIQGDANLGVKQSLREIFKPELKEERLKEVAKINGSGLDATKAALEAGKLLHMKYYKDQKKALRTLDELAPELDRRPRSRRLAILAIEAGFKKDEGRVML